MLDQSMRRMFLFAYVCGEGCIQRNTTTDVSLSFRQVYNGCPENCRFAVTRFIGDTTTTVIDLWACAVNDGGWMEPSATQSFDDYDAAIAATFLTYRRA